MYCLLATSTAAYPSAFWPTVSKSALTSRWLSVAELPATGNSLSVSPSESFVMARLMSGRYSEVICPMLSPM